MIPRRAPLVAKLSPVVAVSNGRRAWFLLAVLAAVLWMNGASDAADSARKSGDDGDEPAIVDENLMVITEEDFDANLIGRRTDALERARQRMREAVQHEIAILDQRCSLSAEQKSKLQLAGRGDVARCFERLAELRQKATAAPLTRIEYSNLWDSVEPVRWAMSNGWFNESSLFWKTLQRTLTAEQLAAFHKLERERALKILNFHCTHLEETTLIKLSAEFRRKFEELLADKVQPLELTGPNTSQVWLAAAKFQNELQPLMHERQWRVFRRAIAEAQNDEEAFRLRKRDRWPYDVSNENELPEKQKPSNEPKEPQP